MPPKGKATARGKKASKTAEDDVTECCVCSTYAVNGKGKATFCEGKCNGWLHQYCVGIPLKHFEKITASSASFFCYCCALQSHGQVTMALKEQLKSLATDLEGLRKSVSELTDAADTLNEKGTNFLPVILSNIKKGYKQPLRIGEKWEGW